MYKVVVQFQDLQDDRHLYRVGDIFPRPDFSVSDSRLAELSSEANRRGIKLIEKIEETPETGTAEEDTTKKRRKTKKKLEE